ncbi:methionine synthase [Thermoproteota archaeon]
MLKGGMFTAIGSWPHADADKVTDLILKNFTDIPCWPQLPKRGFYENMYVQYSEGLPCIVIDTEKEKIHFNTTGDIFGEIQTVYEKFLAQDYDHFAISDKYAKGLHSFKEKIAKSGKKKIVKGQTLGPVSLGLTLTDQDKRLIFYNEQMQDAIVKASVCKAVWQAKFLKEVADKVIIFLDEPYLVSFGSAYVSLTREQVVTMLNEVIDALHAEDVLTGVHCCGSTDWSILMETNVDIINFDAYSYAESMMIYPKQTNDFLSKKKYLAWGIVPTAEEPILAETPENLFKKLTAHQDKLVSLGVNQENLKNNCIITPACGVGSLSEKAAEKVIEFLKGLSNLYKGSQ